LATKRPRRSHGTTKSTKITKKTFVFFVAFVVQVFKCVFSAMFRRGAPGHVRRGGYLLLANELYRLDGSGCKAEREHDQGEGGEKLPSAIERHMLVPGRWMAPAEH